MALIELILGLGVVVVAFLVIFSIFSGSARHAVQSRNHTLAMLVAESMLEELRAHNYGDAAPQSWPVDKFNDDAFVMVVEGLPQQMLFHKKISFANSSFIGKNDSDSDKASITVTWEEKLDPSSAAGMAAQKAQRQVTADVVLGRPKYVTQ
jgi:type II secretory pathway pseudopilin PulG